MCTLKDGVHGETRSQVNSPLEPASLQPKIPQLLAVLRAGLVSSSPRLQGEQRWVSESSMSSAGARQVCQVPQEAVPRHLWLVGPSQGQPQEPSEERLLRPAASSYLLERTHQTYKSSLPCFLCAWITFGSGQCACVSVLEGDFRLTPYISRCKCPTRSSLGSGFSSLQAAGTASGALLPKTPHSVLLLSSAVLLKCQLLSQPLSGSLQRHSLAASSQFSRQVPAPSGFRTLEVSSWLTRLLFEKKHNTFLLCTDTVK